MTPAADTLPAPPDALGVRCQQCGVARGQPCLQLNGARAPKPHSVRAQQSAKMAARAART